jgi:hypothetical protein
MGQASIQCCLNDSSFAGVAAVRAATRSLAARII